jgi:hypothetical protein
LKMTNIQGNQAPAKWQEMLKKFENSSMKTITEQCYELTDTIGNS